MHRIIAIVIATLCFTGLSFGQGNGDVKFTPGGTENEPAKVEFGDTVTIKNTSPGSVIAIQIRDASDGSGGPPLGNPILIFPGDTFELTIPNDPALLGFKFELDPDKYTPNAQGGFTHDPMGGA